MYMWGDRISTETGFLQNGGTVLRPKWVIVDLPEWPPLERPDLHLSFLASGTGRVVVTQCDTFNY